MNKQLLKKSFVGFMVLTIFLLPLKPISSSPLTNKIVNGDDMLFEKLKTEQLQKVGQLKNFNDKRK